MENTTNNVTTGAPIEAQAVPQTQPTLSNLVDNKGTSIHDFLKRIAEEEASLSPIMAGRESVKMDYICEKYPEGATITGVDIIKTTIEGEAKDTPVFTIAEDDSIFVFGGMSMLNIINAWVKAVGKPVADVSAMIANAGGMMAKFEKSVTKKGNTIYVVTIL